MKSVIGYVIGTIMVVALLVVALMEFGSRLDEEVKVDGMDSECPECQEDGELLARLDQCERKNKILEDEKVPASIAGTSLGKCLHVMDRVKGHSSSTEDNSDLLYKCLDRIDAMSDYQERINDLEWEAARCEHMNENGIR